MLSQGENIAMNQVNRKRMIDRKIVELLIENKSFREIASCLKVGARRTRKVRALAEVYGYLDGTVSLPAYPEALFPDDIDGRSKRVPDTDPDLLKRKDWMIDRLQSGWHPITLYEEIGLPIGRSSFYRFLHRHSLNRIGETSRLRVVPEIVHEPGEALILDWGKLRDIIDPITKKKKTVWAFVGVLGFSRYMMVRLVWSNSITETNQAIESMFSELGGVTTRITSDNPKCFAIEASKFEPLLNPAFERLANHYGFRIECLPPADPEKKGKVERLMPYVRRLYESHGLAVTSEWHGIEEAQKHMDKKVTIANDRKHGTTRKRPLNQFLEVEAQSLKQLPALSYQPEEVSEGNVRRDGHVRFANKYYSCSEQFIHKTVLILATCTQVTIYHGGKPIEIHDRIPADDPRSKSTKPEHLKPWEREMLDQSIYRKRAQKIGPYVDEFILRLLDIGDGFVDTRKIWGVLSLDKKYKHWQIDKACEQAMTLGLINYRTVKNLVALLPSNTPNQENIESPKDQAQNHKFARPMSVYEEQLKFTLH